MEDKLLGQLMDSLRGVEISQSHALELAVFLAWAKTSALEVLPEYAR